MTPVTVIPADLASVATNARSSSFPEEVLNAGVVMLFAELDRSVDLTTSMAKPPHAGVVATRKTDSCKAWQLARRIEERKDEAGELIIN